MEESTAAHTWWLWMKGINIRIMPKSCLNYHWSEGVKYGQPPTQSISTQVTMYALCFEAE